MELYTINNILDISMPISIRSEDIFSSNNRSMFRLIFVETGAGLLNINNTVAMFIAPCIFCLNEDDVIRLEKGYDIKAQVIYFSPCIINNILTLEKIRNKAEELVGTEYTDYFYLIPFIERSQDFCGMFEMGPTIGQKMTQLFRSFNNEINTFENRFWRCRTRSFFLEILFLIQYIFTGSKTEEEIKISSASSELNDVILYLHINYQKKITIEDLTNIFHINRTTLSKKFRNSTGMSIIDYLTKLRIKIACMLLKETELPITEILFRIGYTESNHFGRMFKKHIGCSPSEYRKKAS